MSRNRSRRWSGESWPDRGDHREGWRVAGRRLLATFAVAVAGLVPVVAVGGQAWGATTFSHIDTSGFTLDSAATAGRYGQLVTQLEADSRIHRVPLSTVLGDTSAAHTGTWPLCHTTNLDSTYSPSGFCWDHADDTSADWVPQGVTGSGDADASGVVNGKRLIAASWHGPSDTYARISIADYSKPSAGVPYHHLLLVEPTVNGSQVNFRSMQNVHADGLMWRGDLLFVATGTRLQVFSLSHIWATGASGTNAGQIGLYSDGAHARWHAWAMPMIAEYRTVWGPGGTWASCAPVKDNAPCLNAISLAPDRASFITSEYYNPTDGSSPAGGRVIRWPLDTSTGLPAAGTDRKVHATEGYWSPIWHMQGVATDGTAFYLTGDCPGTPPAGRDANNWICIHKALPDQAPHVLTQAPPLAQNLSYWPQTRELWGINERINTTTGTRVVFKILPNG
jgi:hypothetical protein